MVTAKPKFSQHTFDHMRRLIHKVKQKAVDQNDADTGAMLTYSTPFYCDLSKT